jgi:hypothetical protein
VLSPPPHSDGEPGQQVDQATESEKDVWVYRSLRTDIGDLEVIEGSRRKLERIFKALREDVHPEAVSLNCTCVPVLTGDDPADLIKEQRELCPFPIMYHAQDTDGPYNPQVDVVLRCIRNLSAVEPCLDSVNLIGFGTGPELDELKGYLGQLGLEVNAEAVPMIDLAVIERWLRAPLQVVLDHSDWRGIVDTLFQNLPMKTIRPTPPFGPRAVRDWVASIAQADGRSDRLPAVFQMMDAVLGDTWKNGVLEAAGHKVGIVCAMRHIPRLTDPAMNWGLPLLSMLEELGFGVNVVIFDEGAGTTSAIEAVRAVFVQPARHQVSSFLTQADLDAFFRDPNLSLVYSDYSYDHRITSAGRTPFSGNVFEMGLEGAARTLKRLLALCRLRFYRENGRHLGREVFR